MFAPSNAIFKATLTAFIPVILVGASVLIWFIIAIISKSGRTNIKRNIVVTSICILYLLHPMVSRVGFEIFQCVQVDNNEYKVLMDINMG